MELTFWRREHEFGIDCAVVKLDGVEITLSELQRFSTHKSSFSWEKLFLENNITHLRRFTPIGFMCSAKTIIDVLGERRNTNNNGTHLMVGVDYKGLKNMLAFIIEPAFSGVGDSGSVITDQDNSIFGSLMRNPVLD